VASALPAVRISEFHYDNGGTDTGEAIEISGPAGTDLTGWQLVLYNGSATSRAPYTTTSLSGLTIPASCGARGVVVLSYPSNGIQNGSGTATGTDPDGFALVSPAGVVEFLSYEGSLTAASGPAAGMTSTDVGVRELGSEPASPVTSIKRNGAGVWSGPSANSFGVCNDEEGEVTPPAPAARGAVSPETATIVRGATQPFTATADAADDQPIAGASLTWSSVTPAVATVDANGLATGVQPGDALIVATAASGVADTVALRVNEPGATPVGAVRFSEIHYDNTGTDAGEAIEVEGPAGTDLTGWSVLLYTGSNGTVYNTSALSGTISGTCGTRGVVVVNYPSNGIQNGGTATPEPDGFALVSPAGVVEFLSYEGAFTATDGAAAGTASTDIGVAEPTSSPSGQSLQRDAAGAWSGPSAASFGACNGTGGGTTPPARDTVTFSGRSAADDPPLPIGFQAQIFATVRKGTTTVQSPVVWTAETPDVATIDQNGVVTAVSAGTALFRATAANGATATYSLPMVEARASTTARYDGNAEFGEPTDGDASDDFILRYAQYVTSFSPTRGTPNWVSYDIDASAFGAQDRCNCFTYDPGLPQAGRYTTADYTGAGAFHGYGIDRGHLARSADRTSESLDNARTYYFSNIIPQAADLNQGPWAVMENYLGDLARKENKEVYVVAGVAGNKGTVKNEGKITIPTHVWKVAVILPRDQGLSDVKRYTDLEVVSVIMPNDAGVRNVAWQEYSKVTVDSVEKLSGYDVLALLPDRIEAIVESGAKPKPPTAVVGGPYAAAEGAAVAMSGAGSTDPDAGDELTYEWTFGDGQGATGVTQSHSYAQDGAYDVRLIVTDAFGLADTVTTTAAVSNVAPTVGAFAGATLLPGETYTSSGAFTDPGADAWKGTADYGDGSGAQPLALAGKSFSLSHGYAAPGAFTVTVTIADDDVTSSRTQTVTVLTPAQGAQNAAALVDQLVAAGRLAAGNATSLSAKLRAATDALQRGNPAAAVNQLGAALRELDAMTGSGRLAAADAEALRSYIGRVIRSASR
jgi:DNA/RNA endonuclease G (NUC1)